MSDIAIRVDNISKRYRLGERQAFDNVRDAIAHAAKTPLRWLTGAKNSNGGAAVAEQDEILWALRDVSFEVKRGEVLGIIGRNGAGKSTLLKILSRITEPSDGTIDVFGRVASLLEVGTGFHQDLTGRENIYLNGSILGMTKKEIDRKFDEIVAFAGVERFIDTPVKRYSSGMGVRLGFAVAAHLEPEILIVDEVLAVGDAEFQRKCLGKMEDVSREGRTVFFVSHSMPMILRLCSRVMLLNQGTVAGDGDPKSIARAYLSLGGYSLAERVWDGSEVPVGDDVARLVAVRVLNSGGIVSEALRIDEPAYIEVEYVHLSALHIRPTVSIHVINEDDVTIFCSNDWSNRTWFETVRRRGRVRARCKLPPNFLADGRYTVLASVCSYNPDVVHALERDAVTFQMIDSGTDCNVRGDFGRRWPGVTRPLLEWQVDAETSV